MPYTNTRRVSLEQVSETLGENIAQQLEEGCTRIELPRERVVNRNLYPNTDGGYHYILETREPDAPTNNVNIAEHVQVPTLEEFQRSLVGTYGQYNTGTEDSQWSVNYRRKTFKKELRARDEHEWKDNLHRMSRGNLQCFGDYFIVEGKSKHKISIPLEELLLYKEFKNFDVIDGVLYPIT